MKRTATKKNGAKHILSPESQANPDRAGVTVCGKEAANVILWAKATPPKSDDLSVCGRCRLLLAKRARVEEVSGKRRKTWMSGKGTEEKKERKGRTPALAAFPNHPTELVVTFKGTEYKATVNADGTITVDGKTFSSPSRAGKEITGREVDGWTFWNYELSGVGLKKLDTLRKETE